MSETNMFNLLFNLSFLVAGIILAQYATSLEYNYRLVAQTFFIVGLATSLAATYNILFNNAE